MMTGNKNLRETREELESQYLSKYASLAANSTRRCKEAECTVRTAYQRDRDRVLYSKAFRRLMHKTQVFIAPEGDHYRTRLTHTLEVSQISRTIARALRLNEDLTEAIALGHDLGHAPFGHAGEKVLDSLVKEYSGEGFHHSKQSLRVVDYLERQGGLNLTGEVRNGILAHTKGKMNISSAGVFEEPRTLEAAVVRIADRLAYINHDIDDAIRARIISTEDIPGEVRKLFGDGISSRIHTMIMDIVKNSWDKPAITMSPEIYEGLDKLKNFMYERVYEDPEAKAEERKVRFIITQLFEYLMIHPERMTPHIAIREMNGQFKWDTPGFIDNYPSAGVMEDIKPGDERLKARFVCDFIAGMTDRYAIALHSRLFVPQAWNLEGV
jgi:dGTPase